MVTEKLIDIFFGVASGLFKLLPDITWDVNTSAFQYLRDVVDMICYLLPMGTISAIAILIFDLALFRAFMALIRTFREFLPFI